MVSASLVFQMFCGYLKIFEKEGICVMWLLFRPVFLLAKSDAVQVFLNSSAALDKSFEYKFAEAWAGTTLGTSKTEKWRIRRKLLAPAFHLKVVRDYIPVFNEQSAILINRMKRLVSEPWIDVHSVISLCSLDIICQSAMGVRMGAQLETSVAMEYMKAVEELADIFTYRGLRPWNYFNFIFNLTSAGKKQSRCIEILHNFSNKVIKKRKESMLSLLEEVSLQKAGEDGTTHRDFLQTLLEIHLKDPSFTLEDVRGEVDLFLFAGFDTASSVISWALILLGLHPDIQEKVFQELDSIFQGDPKRDVSYDDLYHMKYLENVIKETLRLYPPGAFIARKSRENIKIGKYTVPAGATVCICIYTLQRDLEIFPNPEKFDPDRFSPENTSTAISSTFIPFAAGPRNCLGHKYAMMEMKVILSHILRNFRVTALDQRDKITLEWGITLRTSDPLRLKLTERC